MAKILFIVGIAVPSGLSTFAGRADIEIVGWVADLLPWWGWLIVAAFFALGWLLFAISKRAHRLDEEKKPTLTCNDLRIWNNSGEYFVRAQLKNESGLELSGVKPYIDNILADDPLQQIETIDFRLPLYTQERLRDRFASDKPSDNPARPVDFSPWQPKFLELFSVTEAMGRHLHLVLSTGRKDLIPLSPMEFKCSVYGVPNPIEFLVVYEEIGNDWQVTLTNENGRTFGPLKALPSDE